MEKKKRNKQFLALTLTTSFYFAPSFILNVVTSEINEEKYALTPYISTSSSIADFPSGFFLIKPLNL